MSGTRPVRLIEAETVALLTDRSGSGLHPSSRILLASVLFADSEGVAHMRDGQLRRWCAPEGHTRSSVGFIQRRIAELVAAGALAPGSTPTELRSMIAYGAEGDG